MIHRLCFKNFGEKIFQVKSGAARLEPPPGGVLSVKNVDLGGNPALNVDVEPPELLEV